MLFLRLVFFLLVTVVVMALFTYVWALAQTPWMKGGTGQRGATGIDIYGICAMTLHSPLYWLFAIGMLVAAGWLCRRWVF